MMSLSQTLIILIVCYGGLAPNVMSGLIDMRISPKSVHYCKQHTVRPSLDYFLCNCLHTCQISGTVHELLDKQLVGFVHGEVAFALYRCGLKCFDPDLSPLPLQQTESIEYLLYELIKEGKAENLSEALLYKQLLSSGLSGRFKDLVVALNETRFANSSLVANPDVPHNLGKVCREKFLGGIREAKDAERELEEMLYCRLFINCIDQLVLFRATHLIGPVPSEENWKFFKCARQTFYSSSPVRSVEARSSSTNQPSSTAAQSTIATRAVTCAAVKPSTSLLWLLCGLILFLRFL